MSRGGGGRDGGGVTLVVRVPSLSVNVFSLLRPCLDNSVQCAAMFPQRPSLLICPDLMVGLLYIHDAAGLCRAERRHRRRRRRRGVSVDTFRDPRREKRREKPTFLFFSPAPPHGDDPT